MVAVMDYRLAGDCLLTVASEDHHLKEAMLGCLQVALAHPAVAEAILMAV